MIWAKPFEAPPGTKRCGRCKQFVPVGDFGKNRAKTDGLQVNCKPCRVLDNAASYVKTKHSQNPKRFATSAGQILRNQQIVLSHLNSNPCVDCGERDVVVLQFDHQGNKVANVSALIRAGSEARLRAEIEKCEVVCANCHTRRTATTFNWWKLRTSVASSIGRADHS